MTNPLEGVSASFDADSVSTTGVLSKVGVGGSLKVTNFGADPVDVALDVTGWYGSVWAPTGGGFTASDPVRIADVTVPSAGAGDVAVTGVGGVPAGGVDAVALVVSVEAGTVDASVVVTSSDVTVPPSAVSVTAQAGSTRSVLVQVAPGADGKVRVHNLSGDAVGVAVDVVGWYLPSDPGSPGAGFVATGPSPLHWDQQVADVVYEVPVAAYPSPSRTDAVAVTVTVAQTTAGGEVAVWAGDGPQPPDGVAVSFDAGGAATNTTVVAYPVNGKISVVSTADVFVFVSVSGYWLDATRQASYTYGPTGIRETRTTHEGTAIFGWDRSAGLAMLLDEQTPTGTIRYLYGPGGRPIAQADGAGNVVYLHTDQLGSVRAVTRSDTGAVVATKTYDAWGNPTQTTGDPTATPFGYAGEYTDTETGLVYLRARYYDPTTATFLTRDPAETITREPYAYVGGDPLNATDPSGLCGFLGDGACTIGGITDDMKEQAVDAWNDIYEDFTDWTPKGVFEKVMGWSAGSLAALGCGYLGGGASCIVVWYVVKRLGKTLGGWIFDELDIPNDWGESDRIGPFELPIELKASAIWSGCDD